MNPSFSDSEIQNLNDACKRAGRNFVLQNEEDRTEESAFFKFVGEYKGQAVIFDAFLYTLRTEFEAQLYDWAQEEVEEDFPDFDWENGSMNDPEAQELFRRLINDKEAHGKLGVTESVEFDESSDEAVGIDICLNISSVTDEDIENFVRKFNKGKLKMDTQAYTFELETPSEEA